MIITDQNTWQKFADAAMKHEPVEIFGAPFYVEMISKRNDGIFGFYGEVSLREIKYFYLPFDLEAAKRGEQVECLFDGSWYPMHFFGESKIRPGCIVVEPLKHVAGMQYPTDFRIGDDVRMAIKRVKNG